MSDQETGAAILAPTETEKDSFIEIGKLIDSTVETPTKDKPTVLPDDDEAEADPETGPADEAETKPDPIDFEREVSMPDGMETMTIGALKDFARENQDWKTERETWETTRMDEQNQQLQVRAELNEMLALVANTDPKVVKYLRDQRGARNKNQAELLLKSFPEWSDPKVKEAARPALIETWKEYGFHEHEFGHINDHRVIKALSDLSKLKARLKKSEAAKAAELVKVPVRQKKRAAPSKSQQVSAKIEQAKTGSPDDKNAAISQLIKNG